MLGGPALHFAAIGALLFAAAQVVGDAPDENPRPRIVIPAQRVEQAGRTFSSSLGRRPTSDEQQDIIETLIDREVLFRYALQLGLDRQDAAQRRLALIAGFVASDADQSRPRAELAAQAVAFGLHERDRVFRRMMIDAAERLIRAVMLGREPNQAMLEAYLRDHHEAFEQSSRTRITHVPVHVFAHGEATGAHARALLEELRATSATPEDAAALGDDPFVDPSLPALIDSALARRFGHRFVRVLRSLPVGSWEGPVPSRYGLHLVFVHEREAPRTPDLAEVRAQVRAALKEHLAQEWLGLRLGQLRQAFEVVVEERTS